MSIFTSIISLDWQHSGTQSYHHVDLHHINTRLLFIRNLGDYGPPPALYDVALNT
jgi:hypothetical protein